MSKSSLELNSMKLGNSLGLDLGVIAGWFLWFSLMISFELPIFLNLTALPILLVFGALLWGWRRAALFFLLVAWLYSSLSLAPSGLVWLSLFLTYLVINFWRVQFFIQGALQFAVATFVANLMLYGWQFLFYEMSSSGIMLSFRLGASIFVAGLLHAGLAYLLYEPVSKLRVES